MKINNILLASFLTSAFITSDLQAQVLYTKYEEKTGLYGIADKATRNYIIQPIYKKIDYGFGEKKKLLYSVEDKNGKVGFIDAKGKVIIPCRYDDVKPFINGYAIALNYDSNKVFPDCGVIDSSGKEVIPVGKYRYLKQVGNGVFIASVGNGFGLIDKKENIIVPFGHYDNISLSDAEVDENTQTIACKKNGKWGYIDTKGNEITPFKYDKAWTVSRATLAAVELNGKAGFLDGMAKEVIPCIYEDGSSLRGNFGVAKKGNKWGVVDKNNNILVPFTFDKIFYIHFSTDVKSKQRTAYLKGEENGKDRTIEFKEPQF